MSVEGTGCEEDTVRAALDGVNYAMGRDVNEL